MKTFTKYTLIQIPGWIFVAILLFWAWKWSWLTTAWGIGVFLAWIAKDYFIYPLVRIGYETNTKTVVEHLIGAQGVAKETLNPQGYVEVRAELWKGEIKPGADPIPPGNPILVEGVRDRILIVKKDQINAIS